MVHGAGLPSGGSAPSLLSFLERETSLSSLQVYTLAYVTVAGALLTEQASVTVHRRTNSNPVNTVIKGYSGESPGAGNCEVQVKNAVPSADFEMNPGPYMKSLQSVEIGIIAAGKQLVIPGFIIEDTFSHGVNQEATLEFSFRGVFPDWE